MGVNPCYDKVGLKKGKWTAEEDEKLMNYIKANGVGSWRSLPKNAGLLRCGKSCRLRWMNYLREGVKRGNFTAEEEETIVRLHRSLGNRWSILASHLPGRTDNEIKNYWNSHLSREIYRFRSTGNDAPCDIMSSITAKKLTPRKYNIISNSKDSTKRGSELVLEEKKRALEVGALLCRCESSSSNGSWDKEKLLGAEVRTEAFMQHEGSPTKVEDDDAHRDILMGALRDVVNEEEQEEETLLLNARVEQGGFLESEKRSNRRMDEILSPYSEETDHGAWSWRSTWDHLYPCCSSPLNSYFFPDQLHWNTNGSSSSEDTLRIEEEHILLW